MASMQQWQTALKRMQDVLEEHDDDDAADEFIDLLNAIRSRDPHLRNAAVLVANEYERTTS